MQLKKMFLKVFMFFMSLGIMEKKRLHGILLSFLMILSTLFTGTNATVFAEGTPKIVDATITDFRIEKPKGTEVSELNRDASFYLAMDWKIKDASAQLHTGDYFDIQLPNNLRFPPSYAQTDFTLTDSEGNVIANAHVTHGSPNEAGGTIRVTFNEGINGKYNVHGTIYLGALFNKQKTVDNQKNTFEISVNGETASTELKVVKVGLPADSMVSKWGKRVIQGGQTVDEVQWYASLNYRKSDLENCVISDTLTGNATYIPGSFHLYEVELNDQGGIVKEFANVDLTGKLTLDNANKTFSINLGSVGKKQYRLTYKTTYVAGTTLENHIKVVYDGGSGEGTSTVKDSTAGGTAGGDLANKIKLIKVDADDNAITLANAVFEVTRPDGTKFELTTGTDGTVTSGALTSGTYKVKEKTAPIGYELNGDEYTLQVTSSGGAIQTITNKQIKTSVSVEKEWIGQPATSVTVKLLADNVEKESIVLNAGNNWKHTFNNLPKHDRIDGHEIVYTVKEEQIANYDPAITGDMASGFKITNTNTEKISIPVEKKWVGPAVARVDVKLLVDGEERETLTLSAANHWKGEFEELYKYDPVDGHEIQYTVKEVAVEGYTSAISGTVQTGFTITNTITGKVSVPVTKKWIGKEADSVTVHLYADGTDTGKSATLNAANQWQYTFVNLEQYKDGKAINYTIKEDSIAGYETKVTGDMKGYIVTNTNTEKLTIPVEKKWIGKEAAQVDVKLLVDGEEKETLTLNAANQWKGEFKNLYKYDQTDGHEIQYTVKEVSVEGYTSAISGTAQTGFTITNTKNPVPPTTPKTGDNSNLSLYIGVAVVALAILGFVIVKRFKSSK